MVLAESLACDTPVVATDLPGVRVPVKLTGSGLIIPVGDAEALAQAIIRILEAPARYRGEPEVLVRISTPAAVAEAYEKIFDLAGDRSRSRVALRPEEPSG
jgi:glycosyltransferase involved in cell wall biosynthesis